MIDNQDCQELKAIQPSLETFMIFLIFTGKQNFVS